MKKTNILAEKVWLNDDLILSTKKPFLDIFNNFQNIPNKPHFINKSLWWKGGLLIISIMTISILLKTPTSETNIKGNNNPVIINKIDSIEKNKKNILKEPEFHVKKQAKNDNNYIRENSLIQSIKTIINDTLELKNELKIDTGKKTNLNYPQINDTIQHAIPKCNHIFITHLFESKNASFGLNLIMENGLYGLKNISDKVIVKPQYNRIYKFGDYQFNWALVEKDGLYGFISINGSEVVKPKYDAICEFGDYQFNWALVEKDGLYGFISINGNEVVNPKYDKIFKFGDYQFAWALVEKDGLYGFISINGSEVVTPQFDKIYKFGTKRLLSAVVQKNGLYGFISINGSIVVEPKYQSIDELSSNEK
jgi:hypothetical protein